MFYISNAVTTLLIHSKHILSYCIYFSRYKSREEFCSDVRLIFNNCETFNEDDSPVGKAGHGMRMFFETRWLELTNQKPPT